MGRFTQILHDAIIGNPRTADEVMQRAVQLRRNLRNRRMFGFTGLGQNELLEDASAGFAGSGLSALSLGMHQTMTAGAHIPPELVAFMAAAHVVPAAHAAVNAVGRRLPMTYITPLQYHLRQKPLFRTDVERDIVSNPMFKTSSLYSARRIFNP